MKNIVFDMGNVLTKYKLSDYIGTYTEDEAQAVLLKNQVCASVEWICMDRGTMTDEEAVCSICKRIPQSEWELVERFVENDECDDYEAFNELNSFREQIIEIMEVITAYVDRLRIYEHALNRIEYRFRDDEFDKEYLSLIHI